MEAAQRKPETHSPPFCMKRFAPSALCTLVLGLVLSACSPPDTGGTNNLHGAVTVSFDKNNSDAGSTEANPDNMTILPPATTLGTLPKEPTRPGYRFVEWNMQSDGRGETFTEETPIQRKIHFVVYAKWKPVLNAQLSPGTLTFSPMEKKLSLTLTVSGFKNKADANSVGLDTNIDELTWLSPQFETGKVSGDTKTFVVHLEYRGPDFAEAPTPLKLTLKNIPAVYEYSGGTQNLHIATASGQKNNPIPVHKGNLERFNDYARTGGLALHYQLTENVALEPPAPPETSNWTAIGTDTAPFTGSFDGGGHIISGLIIDSAERYQGLFGYIHGQEAVIQNLGLKGGSVSSSATTACVGSVVGRNEGGTVQNCYSTASVSVSVDTNINGYRVGGVVGENFKGGTVKNCHFKGNVSVSGNNEYSYVGGVVGSNYGAVQNCYATGNVSGTTDNNSSLTAAVGGVVGGNWNGTVENSYATGNVSGSGSGNNVGGVVGSNSATVRNCYATSRVTSTASGFNTYSGGVVGGNKGILQNCYATGIVNGSSSAVGGVVGHNIYYGTVQNCVALNPSVTANTYDFGRVAGWNSSAYTFTGTLTNNHARSPDMQLTRNGTSKNPLKNSLDDVDGADVSAERYNASPFWKGLCSEDEKTGETIFWDFQNVWDWQEGLLPILREVGDEQSPRVQPLSQ